MILHELIHLKNTPRSDFSNPMKTYENEFLNMSTHFKCSSFWFHIFKSKKKHQKKTGFSIWLPESPIWCFIPCPAPCPWPTSSCGTCHQPWRPSSWPPWTSAPGPYHVPSELLQLPFHSHFFCLNGNSKRNPTN